MIPSLGHILKSVQGAWLLFLWDPRGARLFDQSLEGFWKSFFAPVTMGLIYYFVLVEQIAIYETIAAASPNSEFTAPENIKGYLLGHMIAYGLGIAAFPIVMVAISKVFDLGGKYISYIIAYNWASAVLYPMLGILMVAFSINMMGAGSVAGLATAVALIVAPLYLFFITITVLEISIGISIALVLIDFFLGFFIGEIARLFY